jgi:RNA polymerase sigma-70 factor (ECF subfamily)
MLNEADCVTKIRDGDAGAFEELFNTYCQQLINFTRNYVIDKQVAENIVQDVFVRIWQRRKKLDPSKMIKSYLYTSVKNEALKQLRQLEIEKKSHERILESYEDSRPEKEIEGKEIGFYVNRAIDELPEKCREIFIMNRYDNLKYAEIADILDISVKTVETQMGRALKKLREKLKPIFPLILMVLLILLFSLFFY